MALSKLSAPSARWFSIFIELFVLAFAALAASSAPAQTFTVLHSFPSEIGDGRQPDGSLVSDAKGNLYGTTFAGGTADDSVYGTVFELSPDGTETLVHSFFYSAGGLDGEEPTAGLVRDTHGNLYGTTPFAGTDNAGVVFKINAAGTETILHDFSWNRTDGATPGYGNLIIDAAGNLYGTTQQGGPSNSGTVFKIDASGVETVLYSFTGTTDGGYPQGSLVMDSSGNLYGTASQFGAYGYGVVFKLDPTGVETVLHSFKGVDGSGPDGEYPSAGLVLTSTGHLYGTTHAGGTPGCGTVFETDTNGRGKLLYTFTGSGTGDGCNPYSTLVLVTGNLYGTTNAGGAYGGGTVFEISPTGTETVLHSFNPSTDGSNPIAGLMRGPNGSLYGTTTAGGAGNYGTVFELVP